MNDYTENSKAQSMHVVVFTGGEFPLPGSTENYWKCTKAPDFIIAADSGLDAAERYAAFWKKQYNFTPDIILGDMDSLPCAAEKLATYPESKIIRHNPYKDYTDTELALDYAYKSAVSEKCPNLPEDTGKFITLVGGSGGRTDHLLGIFDLFSTKLHPSAWLCSRQVLWYAEQKSVFTVSNLALDDAISIARSNGSRSGGKIEDKGLEWGCKVFRKDGMPSISNRISKRYFEKHLPVQLTFYEGCFILMLPLTASVAITKTSCSLK